MKDAKSGSTRRRPKFNQHITKSGKAIKLNRSLGDKIRSRKELRAKERAAYLSTLPQQRLKRILYKLHPKRVARYWFSRQGLIMGLKLFGIGVVLLFITLAGVFAYFRKDLPNVKDVSGSTLGGTNRYYDRTNTILLWEDSESIRRITVKSDQMSPFIKDATVAVEDRDFFKHGGFNLRGIGRAALSNAVGKGGTQGGSTITQQLVKVTQNYSNDRTVNRKIKELILAVELERTNTKQDILQGYLNSAPYGGIDVGVEAASQDFFHKSAKDLTLDEAAALATIPKSPLVYYKYSSSFKKDSFVARQHYVLDAMFDTGKITSQQRDDAKKIDTIAKIQQRQAKYANIKAPYFVGAAKESFTSKYATTTAKLGGWRIVTTLDTKLQDIAEDEVKKGMKAIEYAGGDKAAFVSEDVKTGQVVAMVGGADFTDDSTSGQTNFATVPIAPGSSVKPYDYTSLIESSDKFGAGSVLYDSQGPIPYDNGGYDCNNKALPERGGNCLYDFSRSYAGPVTLRYALGGSLNVPAVKAFVTAGVNKVPDIATKLGLKHGYKCYKDGSIPRQATPADEKPCGASAGIGDGAYLRLDEHVHAYSSISRNGRNIPQTYILKIEDSNSKTIEEWKPEAGAQAVRPEAAYIVADMMSDPKASFFGVKPQVFNGHKFSIKTGTTNDQKDGLMMGFSTQYTAGVWVGQHQAKSLKTAGMENLTLPIWQGYMRRVHQDLKPVERERPAGIQVLPAFIFTKRIYGQISPSPSTDLFPSWYTGNKKGDSKKKVLDVVSEKLATDCTPERAKKEVIESNANGFSGDKFVPGGAGSNTEEKDDVHKCEDQKPYIGDISITPAGPAGQYNITAQIIQGTHPLSSEKFAGTVNFRLDGQTLPGGAFTVTASGNITLSYTASQPGDKTIVVEVVDGALYDGTLSKTYTFAAGASGATLNLNPPTRSGPGNTNVTFNWNAVEDVKKYRLHYTTGSTVEVNGTSKTVTSVSGGTAFVEALNDSNQVIATSNSVGY